VIYFFCFTLSSALYSFCCMSFAVLLILFNKAALSSYSFPSANVITLFQVDLPEPICCILLFTILVSIVMYLCLSYSGKFHYCQWLSWQCYIHISHYCFDSSQMMCSCSFLYVLRRLRIISFTDGGSLITSDVKATFVPLETLIHTLPLAFTYFLYMVC
jgi:hypothetical protein